MDEAGRSTPGPHRGRPLCQEGINRADGVLSHEFYQLVDIAAGWRRGRGRRLCDRVRVHDHVIVNEASQKRFLPKIRSYPI